VGEKALAATEKRAKRQNALIVFEDESGCPCCRRFERPGHREATRPCCTIGSTGNGCRWLERWRTSRMAALPAFFELRPGAYNDEALIAFLSELYEAESAPSC